MGQISKLSLGKFLASFVSAKVEAKDAKGDSHVEEKKQVIRPPEVAEDFRQVTSLEELRALSQQVEEKNRVLVLFLLPKLEEQVGAARQVAIEYRKDLLFTFAAAPLSGDFLSLWSGAESGGQVRWYRVPRSRAFTATKAHTHSRTHTSVHTVMMQPR